MRPTPFLAIILVIAIGATSCGGTAVDELVATERSSESADAGQDSDNIAVDEANPVCSSLAVGEIETAVGRVVTSTSDMGSNDGFGACTWTFEPLTEGIFEGTAPELTVQTFATAEFYDVALLQSPNRPAINGIGDAAVSRGDGEITFTSNGRAANIGTFFAFDAGQEAAANAAVQELAELLAGRL